MKKNDISPLAAIALLALVLLTLFGLSHYESIVLHWIHLEKAFEETQDFLLIGLASVSVNALMMTLILERVLGYKKQGSRLRSIKKEKMNGTEVLAKTLLCLLLAGLFWKPFELYTAHSLSFYGDIFSQRILQYLSIFLNSSFLLSLSIVLYGSISILLITQRFLKLDKTLPRKSRFRDGLTLGSIGEETDAFDKTERPKWLTIPQKALNGNILVTGSIGTGKTQGTILNYVDQLFTQFSRKPAALILDPKGSFIEKASKILQKHDLVDQCVYLGDIKAPGSAGESIQTFNPVYIDNTLKNSNYLEVANMIRAAAKNFSGKSNESPIWEDSAFNLTKNVIVYCAAVFDYFTLLDCYKTMLIADSTEVTQNLKASLDKNRFDEEERYNIQCALQYFKEYSLFEDKFRSGVLVSSTTFLNQFQNYKAAQIFCPKKEDLTIPSMDEIVDNGKVLLFNVNHEALCRSMGTFIKLHYERSVLNRLKDTSRPRNILTALIADEYQDIVSVGHGGSMGDDKICAKGREANFFFLAASQSLSSIYNAIGSETAAKELIQNFRTRIACHSSDIDTIRNFKELMGQEDQEKTSRSLSEQSQRTTRNFILGGFDSKDANINESISTSQQKEFLITGKDFSRLKSFEAFVQVYDGIETNFYKLFLKPYFLKKQNTKHTKVLKWLQKKPLRPSLCLTLVTLITPLALTHKAQAFPNICSIVNTVEFNSCLNFKYSMTMCGFPPRPCARFSYNVPQTFIEVSPRAGHSHFHKLPGAALQLSTVKTLAPFGVANDEDTQSYHARTLSVPLAQIPFGILPCGGIRIPKLCFDGMSEHIHKHWSTGISDSFQPNFLAWSLAPKACLIKGAVTSATGGTDASYAPDSPMCSVKLPQLPIFPPSGHSACNGWGVFYPRMGSYNGPATLTGALMIASRMKSISSEIFMATPSSFGETWQMISPGSSSCFREGQNIALLDTIKNVREIGRLMGGRLTGYLFVIYKPVSCVRDIAHIAISKAVIAAMKPTCQELEKGLKK